MCSKLNLVTIDGPAGVGKSTVSKRVAVILGFTYLDTGAMYRGVGYYLKSRVADVTDHDLIKNALAGIDLQLVPAQTEDDDTGVIVNGEDVSAVIRQPELAMVASKISAIPVVRQFLTAIQKSYGSKGRIVAEGRDTGTVVFPQAAHKFFLDAQPEERARRRVGQLVAKGAEADYEKILSAIKERDKNDTERVLAPLRRAEDAVLIDTTSLSIDEVVSRLIRQIHKKQ